MDSNTKDRVIELKKKVFSLWESEGKWEPNNPNSPLYGLDRDPLVTMLITAMVYQQKQMEAETANFRKNMVSEFEDAVLPYHLTKATPAVAMMFTAKMQGYDGECHVGCDSDFTVFKETFQKNQPLHFCPLFEANVIGASVKSVSLQPDGSYKMVLDVTDEKAAFGGVGFFFRNLKFNNLSMQIDDRQAPLICPWEYDRFPMNPDFSFWNVIYSKSLVFGTNEQWLELWAALDLEYYMVDPSSNIRLNRGLVEVTLRFEDLKNSSVGIENVVINSFPVVNVTKKSFALTMQEPIVKIADDTDFFMNLVGEKDTLEEFDKFIIRRYGCERFGFDELLRLADELQKRNNTDFYAYQVIPSLQSGDRMNKLRVLLKDIMTLVKKEGEVKTGVYALLRENATVDLSIPLKALYTDGEIANGIREGVAAAAAPSELDLGQTRLLTTTQNGRDEVTNADEKKMLSHYYALTNDKIVTRTDLKMFCIKELRKYGIDKINRVEVVADGDMSRTVNVYVTELNPDIELEPIQHKIERLVEVRSTGMMPVKVVVRQ